MYGDDNGNASYPGGGLTGSFLRARQLLNLVLNTQNLQSDREYEKIRRQQEQTNFENAQADRKRGQQIEDANTQIKLNDMGAQAANPKLESILDDLLGRVAHPRTLINTPVGPQYLPPQTEQSERKLNDLKRTKQAEYEAETEPLAIPDYLGGGQTRVKKGEAVRWLVDAYKANHPDLHFTDYVNGDGTVTTVGRHPQTGQVVYQQSQPGIGKPTNEPRNYSDKEKNAANIRSLAEWKQRYPNGKESDDFLRGIKQYASDNSVSDDEARKALSSSKRARDRYGVSDMYVKDPTKDLEYQQIQQRYLEQGTAKAPVRSQSPTTGGAKMSAKPKVTAQTATQQVDRYAQMRNTLQPGQQAEAESSLVDDLLNAGVVRNERDARSYIQRKLGDNIQVPDSGNKTVYVDAIPDFAKKYFGGDQLKANSWLNDRGYRLMQKVGGAQQ
jgi:hypothetical protein